MDFNLFDILPNGVIVFRDEKIEYINKHLLDILSIGYFSDKNAIAILSKMLNVKDEKGMQSFFNNNDYFLTKNKVIQIEYSNFDEYYIYSFMNINQDLFVGKAKLIPEVNDENNIDSNVAKHFKIHNIKKIMVLTFYKGIPIKKVGKIMKINKDSIDIKVDKKHNISLLNRDDVLLISNKNPSASILHGHIISNKNNIFKIKNFNLSKNDMHLRDGLRIKPDRDMIVKIDDKEFKVYDISNRGISLYIDSVELKEKLKHIKSLKVLLDDEKLHLSVSYLKTIIENEKILKIIFKISAMGEDISKLKYYITEKQNEILREIYKF